MFGTHAVCPMCSEFGGTDGKLEKGDLFLYHSCMSERRRTQ